MHAGEIDGEKWGKEGIQKILFPDPLPSEKSTKGFSDREFIAMLQENIPKQYHEQEKMLELIQDALTLYLKKTQKSKPEKRVSSLRIQVADSFLAEVMLS